MARQKASYTVEAALVMPIVFGVLLAVFFFVLMMYQQATTRAIMNQYSLMASNTITKHERLPDGSFSDTAYRRFAWHYYMPSKNNFFVSNSTEGRFKPRIERVVRSFSAFQDSSIDSVIVDHNRNSSYIEVSANTVYRVGVPFYGQMTGNFTTISTAPEINPSKYIRYTDDANFIFGYGLELTGAAAAHPIAQTIRLIIEPFIGRTIS
jgi:Flp pilus assembly protein TadG